MNPSHYHRILVLGESQGTSECKTVPDSLKPVAPNYGCTRLPTLQPSVTLVCKALPSTGLCSLFSVAASPIKHSGLWVNRSYQAPSKDWRFPWSWYHTLLSLPRFGFPIWTTFITPLANRSDMEPLAASKFNIDLAPTLKSECSCSLSPPLANMEWCFSEALGCKYLQENIFSIISFISVNKHMLCPSPRHQQQRVLYLFNWINYCKEKWFPIFKK